MVISESNYRWTSPFTYLVTNENTSACLTESVSRDRECPGLKPEQIRQCTLDFMWDSIVPNLSSLISLPSEADSTDNRQQVWAVKVEPTRTVFLKTLVSNTFITYFCEYFFSCEGFGILSARNIPYHTIPYVVICCHILSYVVISCHQLSSAVISCHQLSSAVISCQKLS